MQTAFQKIEEVLKSNETTIFKEICRKAGVSNGALLAYLKRKKLAES